jgi:uncharacterized membrane protein YqaE (UPF0057 family)
VKRFGTFLIGLGLTVGVGTTVAVFGHLGLAGAPWLVNIALAKLGYIAAGGLMAGGAVSARAAIRRERTNQLRDKV